MTLIMIIRKAQGRGGGQVERDCVCIIIIKIMFSLREEWRISDASAAASAASVGSGPSQVWREMEPENREVMCIMQTR